MSLHRSSFAVLALTTALASAQYGPGGQYGPDSSGSGSSSSSSSSSNPYSSSSSNPYSSGSFSSSSIPFGGDFSRANKLILAHGVLASLAFILFFPLGGILIRVLSVRHLTRIHAGTQILGFLLFTTAVGIGIYFARQIRFLNHAHPIIGLTVFGLLIFQPILGFVHHKLFKKYQKRTVWSYAHLWLGRAIITLGIINGGLGLMLARNNRKAEIAYGVCAGVMWLAYVGSAVYGEVKRKRQNRVMAESEKYGENYRRESDGSRRSGVVEEGSSPVRGYRYV